MADYKSYSLSIIGKGHVEENIPCQDSSNSTCIDGVSFVIVCDGCGSNTSSDVASKLLVDNLPLYVSKNFDALYEKKEEEIKKDIVEYAANTIISYAKENELDPKQMNTTFLFAAAKNEKYVLCRSGDGGIVATFADGGYEVIEEDKSQYQAANHSSYLNPETTGLIKGDDTLSGAFVFTDGLSNDATLDMSDIKYFVLALRRAVKGSEEDIKSMVDKLVDKKKNLTYDDISVAILALKEVEQPKVNEKEQPTVENKEHPEVQEKPLEDKKQEEPSSTKEAVNDVVCHRNRGRRIYTEAELKRKERNRAKFLANYKKNSPKHKGQ